MPLPSIIRPSDPLSRYSRLTPPEIVSACLNGDAQAWDALIDRYQALIYSTLLRAGLSGSDADDLFQDVSLLLYQHLGDLRDTNKLAGWLVATTRREVWRLHRRRGTGPSQMPEQEWLVESATPIGQAAAPAPEAVTVALEEQQLVREAMTQLQEKCRSLLTLLYMKDPPGTYTDVTEQLGMPLGSIGPTRARCLQHLQKLLHEAGF